MKWVERSLSELGAVSRGRSRHRPRDAAHLYGGPYPFVQTGDVKHAGLYLEKFDQTYSDAGLAQSKLWPAGTLCITIAQRARWNLDLVSCESLPRLFGGRHPLFEPSVVCRYLARPIRPTSRIVHCL